MVSIAFDPPFPSFEGPTARRRLNQGDATFIDVVHTNARNARNKAIGFETQLGHADFYPNGQFFLIIKLIINIIKLGNSNFKYLLGGSIQPGCESPIAIRQSTLNHY